MSGQKHVNPVVKHWENLHVKQWVAITHIEDDDPLPEGFMMFGARNSGPQVDGVPLQIVAMSWPFVCLQNGRYRTSVDIRTVRLTTLHPTYVKAMQAGRSSLYQSQEPAGAVEVTDERPESKRNVCPICEGPLVLKCRVGEPLMLTCEECGFRGGRGETA